MQSFLLKYAPMFFLVLRIFILTTLASSPFALAQNKTAIRKTSLELPRDTAGLEKVRVALVSSVSEIKIATPFPFEVKDAKGRPLFRGEKMVSSEVRASTTGIQIGAQNFRETPLSILSKGEGIKVGLRTYPHGIMIWREVGNKITVINEVSIEEYLKGVLPLEANPKWKLEALKAQAIVSRSYALFNAIENRKGMSHMTRDVMSQVYGGKTAENIVTNRAIEETRGKILTYDGKIFPAYFHSTCGGGTTHAEYLWNVEAHPAMRGVSCNFCRASKHYRWEAYFTNREIEDALKKGGIKISGVRNFSIKKTDATGRARSFLIEGAKGKQEVHSNDFRIWMDPAKFKSTLITDIEADGQGYRLQGRGWGHGVGLCQYGLKELAELGYTAEDILFYYFPGSSIRKLD